MNGLTGMSKQNQVLWQLALEQRQHPLPLFDEFRRLVSTAVGQLGVQRGSVWLYRQQAQMLECVVLFDTSTGQYTRGQLLTAAELPRYFHACATSKYIDASDAHTDPRTSEFSAGYLTPLGIASMLDIPIFVGSRQKGVVCFEQTGERRRWSEEDKAFAASISDLVALTFADNEQIQQAELIHTAMESAAEAIMFVTPDGRITRHNRKAERLFGLPAGNAESPGIHVNSIIPGAMTGSNGLLDGLFGSEGTKVYRTDDAGIEAMGAGGSPLRLMLSASCVRQGPHENALLLLLDISERYENDRRLKESEALYRTVVEDQPDMILRTRPGGFITFANKSVLNALGLSLQQISGRNVFEFAPADEHALIQSAIAQITPDDPVARYANHVILPDGSRRLFSWVVRAFFDDNQLPKAYQIIGRDITREREAEERLRASQQLEAMAVFAGGMAHDLNNLLTPILGYSDLARTTLPQDLPQVGYLNVVMNAAIRAKDLTRMVLVFGRRDFRQDRQPLQSGPLAREITSFLKKLIDSKIHVLDRIDLDAGWIKAAPSDLYQIMSNLCTNAVHAMPAGGTLTITCTANRWHEQPCVQLEISDTGSGIDPAIQGRIFEPFFTTKSKEQGTGLGLSVVKGLVAELGGDILCKSEQGKGTSFVITLPVTASNPLLEAGAQGASSITGAEKILVVDDDEPVAISIRDGLQQLGYRVETRSSANAALAEFKQHSSSYSLVVTDCTMPVMNGFELARKLRALNRNIPVVLMSGYDQIIIEEDISGSSIASFIEKPFTSNELAVVIRKVLRESSLPE